MTSQTNGKTLALESTAFLLAELRDGNARAREILFQRYLSRLQRWARGRLPRGARGLMDTDDVVQQTLANAVVKLEGFEPAHAGGLQGYLRTSVLNQIRDQIRRAHRRPPMDGRDVGDRNDPSKDASPLDVAIGAETVERYERALARMKDRDREIIIARVELGLSYDEIATEFDKPSPDAARMATSRAVRRLAVLLKAEKTSD